MPRYYANHVFSEDVATSCDEKLVRDLVSKLDAADEAMQRECSRRKHARTEGEPHSVWLATMSGTLATCRLLANSLYEDGRLENRDHQDINVRLLHPNSR